MNLEENMKVEITADEVIIVAKKEYDELRRKANAMDILEADIRMKIDGKASSYELIDDDLVLLLTGMKAYQMEKRRAEALNRKDEGDE